MHSDQGFAAGGTAAQRTNAGWSHIFLGANAWTMGQGIALCALVDDGFLGVRHILVGSQHPQHAFDSGFSTVNT